MSAKVTKLWKGRKKPNRITKPGKYLWSDKERDPEMLFLIERTNEDPRSVNAIANAAYVSPGTISAALDGNTRRPQNATLTLWAAALNLKRGFVDADGKVHIVEPWQARIAAMKKTIKERKKEKGRVDGTENKTG